MVVKSTEEKDNGLFYPGFGHPITVNHPKQTHLSNPFIPFRDFHESHGFVCSLILQCNPLAI